MSPQKGMFYCFGCQEGGDIFAFLMKFDGRTFGEVAEDLAASAGVDIPKTKDFSESPGDGEQRRTKVDLLLRINDQAASFFTSNLFSPRGQGALNYLTDRGLSKEMISNYRLGYAPSIGDALCTHLKRNSFSLQIVETIGLVRASNRGGYYDWFRERIIFPIMDVKGKVLAFGGRLLSEDAQGPKYINSPESEIYSKRKTVYGMPAAMAGIRKEGRLLLVEGYMDVLALHQNGIGNAVATCGTALTLEHVKTLRRYSRNFVALFDADEGGRVATKRSAAIFLEGGIQAKAVEMPAGEDPDSLIRKEKEESFRKRLDRARPVLEVVIEDVTAKAEGNAAKKALSVKDLAPTLALVESMIERDVYVKMLAERLDVSETSVRQELQRCTPGRGRQQSRPAEPVVRHHQGKTPEEQLWEIVTDHPKLLSRFNTEDVYKWMDSPVLVDLLKRASYSYIANKPDETHLDVPSLLAGLEDRTLISRLTRIAVESLFSYDDGDEKERADKEKKAERCFNDVLCVLKQRQIRQEERRLRDEIAKAEQSGEAGELERLFEERMNLAKRKEELETRVI